MAKRIYSKIGANLLVSVGSILFTVILLELVLRLFFPVSDIPLATYDPAVGRHLAPNQAGTWVVGAMGELRGRYQVNSAGWNSTHEYSTEKPKDTLRIAVIGDSYIEALQVDVDKAFPALVEQSLKACSACAGYRTIEVYSFGHSGAPLSQYLAMMRYAEELYHPDVYVVTIIANDFDESIIGANSAFLHFRQNDEGEFEEVQPVPFTPSRLRRFLLNFALVRYVYGNLNVPTNLGELKSMTGEVQYPQLSASEQDMVRRLTAQIFGEYQAVAADGDGKLLLVMDAIDRHALYQNTDPLPTWAWQNRIANEIAADRGIDLIDLTPVFTEAYQRNGRPFNSPADYHWNEYGHAVVADVVTQWMVDHVCLPADTP